MDKETLLQIITQFKNKIKDDVNKLTQINNLLEEKYATLNENV